MKPLETVYWMKLILGVLAGVVCLVFLLVSGAIPQNLVLNPSVEVAGTNQTLPQNWSSSGNGAEWSTTYVGKGDRSIRINVTNATAEWTGNLAHPSGGVTYQVSGFFKGIVVADQFLLTIKWFSDQGMLDFISDSDVSVPVGNYSQHGIFVKGDFAAPERTESCQIVFRAVNGTGDLYGDDFDFRQVESSDKFVNSVAIAIIIYALFYYYLKIKFRSKVEKTSKLLTTGIGMYILSWIVVMVLLYTMIAG